MDTRREHLEDRESGARRGSASTTEPRSSLSADRLRQEITAHEATRRELAAVRAELRRSTDECELIKARATVDVIERTENEAHLRLLMRELTHRSKNLLAVIQGMARQTAHHVGDVESFLDRFGARLQALARSHDLLVQESWHGASLDDLIRSQLGHYLDREKSQVSLEGPDVQLSPEAAQSLGLALHELATNAAKHGALSSLNGRVRIEWNRLAADTGGGIEIIWSESQGPKVDAPTKRGFGSLVIERNLSRTLGAEVELTFAAGGLRCRVTVPQVQLSDGDRPEPGKRVER